MNMTILNLKRHPTYLIMCRIILWFIPELCQYNPLRSTEENDGAILNERKPLQLELNITVGNAYQEYVRLFNEIIDFCAIYIMLLLFGLVDGSKKAVNLAYTIP